MAIVSPGTYFLSPSSSVFDPSACPRYTLKRGGGRKGVEDFSKDSYRLVTEAIGNKIGHSDLIPSKGTGDRSSLLLVPATIYVPMLLLFQLRSKPPLYHHSGLRFFSLLFFLLSYTPVPLFISSVQLSGSIDFDTREFLFFLRYTLVAIFRLYCHRR